jgi:Periplasmic binding protein
MTSRFIALLCASTTAAVIAGMPAMAEDTVKLAYVDPLSGGGASIGEVGLKVFNYLAEATNAQGGILGRKLEIVPYDSKLNAQETLVHVQKAIDSGVRFITQGNSSAVAAAIEDFVAKYNDRNPGKEVLYFNYAAVDPVLTNDKCSYWHFRLRRVLKSIAATQEPPFKQEPMQRRAFEHQKLVDMAHTEARGPCNRLRRNRSGNLAKSTAMRRASSRVSRLAAARRPGSSS